MTQNFINSPGPADGELKASSPAPIGANEPIPNLPSAGPAKATALVDRKLKP